MMDKYICKGCGNIADKDNLVICCDNVAYADLASKEGMEISNAFWKVRSNNAMWRYEVNSAYVKYSNISLVPNKPVSQPSVGREHSHYFKPCPYAEIDVYRVLELFGVTDQAIGHAIKKLLVAGGRGQKNIDKDVKEAIDTLKRWQEMRKEDGNA